MKTDQVSLIYTDQELLTVASLLHKSIKVDSDINLAMPRIEFFSNLQFKEFLLVPDGVGLI